MDSSNWIDFNSPVSYDNINENLGFLDEAAQEKPSSQAPPQQEPHPEPVLEPPKQPNNFILDIQKWTEFEYGGDGVKPKLAAAAPGKKVEVKKEDPKYVPITPQSLDLRLSYRTSKYLQYAGPQAPGQPALASNSSSQNGVGSMQNFENLEFFTPLISPAMTPLDTMILTESTDHPQQYNDLNQGFFTPLTSPAINPLNNSPSENGNLRTKKSSLTSLAKRNSKTSSGRILKNKSTGNSPVIKTKSPMVRAGQRRLSPNFTRKNSTASINEHVSNVEVDSMNFAQLENFSLPENLDTANTANGESLGELYSNNNSQSSLHSGSGYNYEEEHSKPVTPATLMNLKFADKAKLKSSINEITFQSTPQTSYSQLKSKTLAESKSMNAAFSSFKTYKSKSNSNGMDPVVAHQTQFKLSNFSSSKSLGNLSDGNSTHKKSTHREAEKGRRDRMNIAIHDLALLIPEQLTNTVAVPSKATTVELASSFIETLLQENEKLRKQLDKEEK